MGRRIRKTLTSCDLCQKCKHSNHPRYGVSSGIKCLGKNQLLAIDFIGPLPKSTGGVKYILITLDVFTKFVKLYKLKNATTNAVINRIFNDYVPRYGKPETILHDHGTQFKSKKWTAKLQENGIRPIFNPVHHPMSNMAERPIREVKRCLRTYCHENHRSWATCLEDINSCLNEVYHETTGFTPNELHLDQKDHRFWEEVLINPFKTDIPMIRKVEITEQRIRSKQKKRASILNNKRKITTFNEGDQVLVKSFPQSSFAYGETAKLFFIYFGPLIISKRIGSSTYMLCDGTGKIYGPYHVSTLKPYISPGP